MDSLIWNINANIYCPIFKFRLTITCMFYSIMYHLEVIQMTDMKKLIALSMQFPYSFYYLRHEYESVVYNRFYGT